MGLVWGWGELQPVSHLPAGTCGANLLLQLLETLQRAAGGGDGVLQGQRGLRDLPRGHGRAHHVPPGVDLAAGGGLEQEGWLSRRWTEASRSHFRSKT